MSQETEKFLQAEKDAENLVLVLKGLQDEIAAYQSATHDLDAVRTQLVEFIASTHKVVEDTYECVKTLKNIGGPQIIAGINGLEQQISDTSSIGMQSLKGIRVIALGALFSSILSLIIGGLLFLKI